MLFSTENRWGRATHGGSLLMVRSLVFDTIIFRYFNLRNIFQCVNSVVRVARFNCYSRYRIVLSFLDQWFTCYYYKNLLEVHPVTCNRALFYPCLMCFWGGPQYLILSLPERPYSGLIGEASSPTMFYLICLSQLAFDLCWNSSFLHGVFTTPWPLRKILKTQLCYLWLHYTRLRS